MLPTARLGPSRGCRRGSRLPYLPGSHPRGDARRGRSGAGSRGSQQPPSCEHADAAQVAHARQKPALLEGRKRRALSHFDGVRLDRAPRVRDRAAGWHSAEGVTDGPLRPRVPFGLEAPRAIPARDANVAFEIEGGPPTASQAQWQASRFGVNLRDGFRGALLGEAIERAGSGQIHFDQVDVVDRASAKRSAGGRRVCRNGVGGHPARLAVRRSEKAQRMRDRVLIEGGRLRDAYLTETLPRRRREKNTPAPERCAGRRHISRRPSARWHDDSGILRRPGPCAHGARSRRARVTASRLARGGERRPECACRHCGGYLRACSPGKRRAAVSPRCPRGWRLVLASLVSTCSLAAA